MSLVMRTETVIWVDISRSSRSSMGEKTSRGLRARNELELLAAPRLR